MRERLHGRIRLHVASATPSSPNVNNSPGPVCGNVTRTRPARPLGSSRCAAAETYTCPVAEPGFEIAALPLAGPHPTERERLEHRARLLVFGGLAWHFVEFVIALVAGVVAGSIALIGFGADSLIEALAGVVVVWFFTGSRVGSSHAERRAQQMIAVRFSCSPRTSAVEAVRPLAGGDHPQASWVGIGLVAFTAVTMPLLARAKRRRRRRLSSAATVNEASQTSLCAYLSIALLVGLRGSQRAVRLVVGRPPRRARRSPGSRSRKAVELARRRLRWRLLSTSSPTRVLSKDRVSGPIALTRQIRDNRHDPSRRVLCAERRVQAGEQGGRHESCSGGEASVLWFVCRSGSGSRALCLSRDCQCRVSGGDHQWGGHGHHGPLRAISRRGPPRSKFTPRSMRTARPRGHVDCLDQVGSTFPGNIFGEVTSWEGSLDGSITLNVVGKFVGIPRGHPSGRVVQRDDSALRRSRGRPLDPVHWWLHLLRRDPAQRADCHAALLGTLPWCCGVHGRCRSTLRA